VTLRPNQNLDQMLEAVLIVARDDLMQARTPGLVHIKYRFAEDHSIASLQVWASETRGRWLLVCEYSGADSAAGSPNLAFSNGYRSDLLTQYLDFVIEHQSEFARAPELYRDSLVQVQVPTENDKARALKLVHEAQTPNELQEPAVLATAS